MQTTTALTGIATHYQHGNWKLALAFFILIGACVAARKTAAAIADRRASRRVAALEARIATEKES